MSGPPAAAERKSTMQRHRRVLALYLVLSIILTYPLILRLSSHIPGGNVDEGAFLWNIWWVKHAVLDLHVSPLTTDMIFYPVGANLAYYTLTLLNGVVALPLTLAFGAVVASNVLFLASFALSGFAMYLLALDHLPRRGWATLLAAIIAGLVYTFSSGHFLYAALGQYDYVSLQWLPLALLFGLRAIGRRGWRNAVLAGLFAAFAALTEMNFIVFLAVAGVVIAVYAARQPGLWTRSAVGRLAVAAFIFVLGFAPLGIPIVLGTVQEGDYLVRGWGGAEKYVVDLLGPLIPSPLHPLLGPWARAAARAFTDINFGFVGYAALLLGIVGALGLQRLTAGRVHGPSWGRHGQWGVGLWVALLVVFWLLALGPLLHINGRGEFDLDGLVVSLPLPYIVFHYLPILRGARIPGRFAIMATLALAMLVALAVAAILARLKGRNQQALVAVALSLVIVLENLAVPLPLTNAVAPEIYSAIAADPDDVTVLQIPLGWRDGFGTVGRERTLLQSYQAVHGKRILGGNTSRSPQYLLPYFANMPVVRSILTVQEDGELDATVLEADRAVAADVLRFLGVRYIVVHGDYVHGVIEEYLRGVLPVECLAEGIGEVENSFWMFEADGKRVDRRPENAGWAMCTVTAPAAEPATVVDAGTPLGRLHLVAGWSRDEEAPGMTFVWAEARQTLLLLRLETAKPTSLVLRAAPFSYNGAPQQTMAVAVNGRRLGTVVMQEGWSEYRLQVPAAAWRRGMNQVSLTFAHLASPSQVMGTSDRRNLAAALDWLRVE